MGDQRGQAIDAEGSNLPSLSKADEDAFAAMEAEAAQQRSTMTPGQSARLVEAEPDPAPAAPPAPAAAPAAPAAPAPAAAVPAAPAAPAPPAQPAANPDEDVPGAVSATDGNRYVPLAAHIGERKALQGQIADMKAALEASTKAYSDLVEIAKKGAPPAPPQPAAAQPPAPPPEPPKNPYDKATHPFEHQEWETAQVKARLEARDKADQEADAQRKQQEATSTAQRVYVGAHQTFTADPKNAGYADAYKFITQQWQKQHLALGYNEAEAIQLANTLEWQVVQTAVARNMHPSQALWQMAKAAGWTAPTPASPGIAAGGQPPAPGAPAAPAAPAPLTPQQQIQIQAKGAAAAVSLSDAAGASGPETISLAGVTNLPKEQFDAMMSGAKGEELFRKLAMGTRTTAAA